MKILVLPSWYPNNRNTLNGTFFKEQSEAIAQLGHDVRVLAVDQMSLNVFLGSLLIGNTEYDYGTLPTKRVRVPRVNNKVFSLPIPGAEYLSIFLYTLVGLWGYVRFFARWRPDVVVVHSFFSGSVARSIRFLFGVEYYYFEHSSKFASDRVSKVYQKQVSKLLRGSTGNFAVSSTLADHLRVRFKHEVGVVPNFVDTDFFKLKSEPKEYDFINIAFMTPNKNQSQLLHAFSLVLQGRLDLKLVIIGSGPEEVGLKNLAERLGIKENVVFAGALPRGRVAEFLSRSRVLVITSRYETFGVVGIEAMSCGIPVLSSRCGGPETYITDDVGMFFDSSVDDLAMKMKEILEGNYSPEAIREFVFRNYSINAVATNVVRILLGEGEVP